MTQFHQYKWEALERLALLTFGYFIIEYLLNFILFKHLAVTSDAFAVQSLEYWGKIIAGLGLGLFITRALFLKNWQIPPVGLLIMVCLFTIPFSFKLQDEIAERMANKASDQTLNEAALVMAVKSTIVPHYDFSNASYSMSKDLSHRSAIDKLVYPFKSKEKATSKKYVQNEEVFLTAAEPCKQVSIEKLGLADKKPIDTVFWGINTLQNPITKDQESKYKELINSYYNCLYEDKDYRENHIGGVGIGAVKSYLNSAYSDYLYNTRQYNQLFGTGFRGAAHKARRKEFEKKWKESADERFGFSTSIKPNLTKDQFLRHPDVKKAFVLKLRENGQQGSDKELLDLYPYNENFDSAVSKRINDNLDKREIPNYTDVGLPLDNDDFMANNKRTYKALVMPLVGLGLSAFFLVLNIILMIYNFTLHRKGFIVAGVGLFLMLAWFVFFPNVILATHETMSQWGPIAKWTYYHENNLSLIHRILLLFFK